MYCKRLASLCLILCLLACGMAPALGTQNAGLFLHIAEDYSPESIAEKWIINAASLGNTLYVLTEGTLEKWTPGMASPQQVLENVTTYSRGNSASVEEKPVLSVLFADKARLFALDTESGRLWKLVDGEELLAPSLYASLDWSSMLYQTDDGYTFFNMSIVDMVADEGTLWLLCFDYEKDPSNPILFRWNMETGTALEPIQDTSIHALTPYKDGQFLCILKNAALYDESAPEARPLSQLGVFDPKTGNATILLDLGNSDPMELAYDAESNTAYYLSNEVLMSLPGLELPAKASAYFPMPDPEVFGCGLLDEGMYYVSGFNGVIVRELNTDDIETGAFTVYGAIDNRPLLTLVQEAPEIHAQNASAFYHTAEELMAALQEEADAPDVLLLDSNQMPVSRLIGEGYAMDLSGNAAVQAFVGEMSSMAAGYASQGEQLYALPLELDCSVMGYNEDIWASLGLSEEDLPKTYGELLDFAASWQTAYAKDHPGIRLFDQVYAKESLLFLLLDQYAAYCQRESLPLDFGSELFIGLMQKLDSLSLDEAEESGDVGDIDEYWGQAVFTTYLHFGQFYTEDAFAPLPLALDAGMEPVILANLRVAIVNPSATHAGEAAQYLNMLMRYFNKTGEYITLFPQHNEPVLYPLFDQELQEREADLARAKGQLETASPEEAADLSMEIAFLEDLVAQPEEYITRDLVTQEQINTFRSRIEPFLSIAEPNPLYRDEADSDVYELSRQYIEGVITLEQFLETLSQRVNGLKVQ